MSKKKLFCIPYAGGSAVSYYKFAKHLTDKFELIPLELAGKGMRDDEENYASYDQMIEDLTVIVRSELDGETFAVFGYSMGAIIAYELANNLQEKYGLIPEKIIFAASMSPYQTLVIKDMKNLSDDKIMKEMDIWGDVSNEVRNNRKALDYFIDTMRSDMNLMSMYVPSNNKLKSEVYVFYSDDENINKVIYEWDKFCEKKPNYKRFEKGHFFINHDPYHFINELNNILDIEY